MTQRLLGYLTSYFKEEQIDAFVTKSSIKCVQECQLSVLDYTFDIMVLYKSYNLHY